MSISIKPRTPRWLERVDQDLAAIEAEIIAAGGQVTEEQEQAIDRLCQERATLPAEACYAMDQHIAYLSGILAQAKEVLGLLEARRKDMARRAVKQIDRDGIGSNKVDTRLFRAHTAAGAGKVELLVPVETLPEQYRREKREWVAETTLIKAALKAGMAIMVEGEDGKPIDCAKLIEGRHLVVTPKKDAEIVDALEQAIGLEEK